MSRSAVTRTTAAPGPTPSGTPLTRSPPAPSDIALAIGVEKLKDVGTPGLPVGGVTTPPRGTLQGVILSGGPGSFAVLATAYFAKYGLDFNTRQRDAGPHLCQEPLQRVSESQGAPAQGSDRSGDHRRSHSLPGRWACSTAAASATAARPPSLSGRRMPRSSGRTPSTSSPCRFAPRPESRRSGVPAPGTPLTSR